jgi:hypothetical protein
MAEASNNIPHTDHFQTAPREPDGGRAVMGTYRSDQEMPSQRRTRSSNWTASAEKTSKSASPFSADAADG